MALGTLELGPRPYDKGLGVSVEEAPSDDAIVAEPAAEHAGARVVALGVRRRGAEGARRSSVLQTGLKWTQSRCSFKPVAFGSGVSASYFE